MTTSIRRWAKTFSISRPAIDFSGVNGEISHVDGSVTASGVTVSPSNALKIAACWIAVTILADEISSLSRKIVRKEDTKRTPVQPPGLEPLWLRPNPDQVLMEWLATNVLSLMLSGVSYNMLGWRNSGDLDVMWPQRPEDCHLERGPGESVVLKVAGKGELVNRPKQRPEFMMIPLYRLAGDLEPVSPVKYAAELLGLSKSYEQMAASLTGKGFNPSAVMMFNELVDDEIAEKLGRRLMRLHSGGKSGGVAVVGGPGANLSKWGMSMVDAQFIEQNASVFDVVMALWRVPPTVAGMVGKPSTWGTGVAEFARGLERFTLRPIVERFQAHFESYILQWSDPSLQYRFKFDSMLSASPKEKAEIQRLNLMGAMTSQERVLAQNDEPPFEEGETVYSILSMATDEDRRLQRLKLQAEAYGGLIRAGVTPEAAAVATGFDPAQLAHTGLRPVTVAASNEGTLDEEAHPDSR